MRWVVICAALATPALAEVTPLAEGSVSETEGLAAWGAIHEVLTHPRCANCHVGADNIPLWTADDGGKIPHGMYVSGGEARDGSDLLPCATCHRDENGSLPHSPPGAPHWALAPVEMQWTDRTTAEICAQLQDPRTNGGRSLIDVANHVAEDALVHWGWAPGPGREPAPGSAEELVRYLLEWSAAGAPCP